MSGYDYGNARLRAMKSRLLTRRELDALTAAGSPQGLISALTNTSYQKSIENALARTSGMECIAEALRYDLISTLGNVRNFYDGKAGEMVAILLRSYDIHNLKAILRGLSNQGTAGEILSILLPVGELKIHTLTELSTSPSPRAAIDVLASQGYPFAHPLLQLRAEYPGIEVPEMEIALNRWFFQETFQILQRTGNGGRLLLSAMQMEADMINLLTVLRFVHAPGERRFLREWFHTDELNHFFIGPGKIRFDTLAEAGRQDTMNAAMEILAEGAYEAPLTAGLRSYGQTALVSEFEKHLNRFRLAYLSRLVTKDPLGIGVLLSYQALKVNEVSNIRWIAQGINLGLKPETIRSELEVVR